MNKKTKETLIFGAKMLISAVLLYVCISIIDLATVIRIWRQLEITDLLLMTGIFMLTIFVGALRSVIFFRGMDIKLSYILYTKLYYIGYFFNNFIPSGVGGDVMRGWIAGKRSDNMKGSYSAILAERISGLMATVFIAIIFMWFVDTPKPMMMIIGALNVSLWLLVLVLLMPKLTAFIKKTFSFLPFGIADKVGDFAEQVSSYRTQPKIMIGGFLMSVMYQLSIIFSVYIASVLIKSGITFPQMCVIAPLVWTISMIPIAPNAIGLRETSFAKLFEIFGAAGANGATVGALFLFVSVVCGLLGGLVFGIENMLDKKKKNRAFDHVPE